MIEENLAIPELSPEEIRVLGALIEKSRATPEYYPMTLNGLQNACNQKSARKPVVQYNEQQLSISIDSLKKKGLISTVVGGGSRAVKYKHNLAIVYPLVPEQLVVLALLFLRGPLTVGEINNASGRMYEFTDLQHVSEVMENLAEQQPAYLIKLPKAPGQKEARYTHCFQSIEDLEQLQMTNSHSSDYSTENNKELEERVTRLEEELQQLKNAFDSLMNELS